MNIRRNSKDKLKNSADISIIRPDYAGEVSLSRPRHTDKLVFWTEHFKEVEPVDLREFRDGTFVKPRNSTAPWTGPYRGRPQLIEELLPAIQKACRKKAPSRVVSISVALRHAWRIFDDIEREALKSEIIVPYVNSVGDIGLIHRDRLFQNIPSGIFSLLTSLFNSARADKKLSNLYWLSHSSKGSKSASDTAPLPTAAQSLFLRSKFRESSYKVLDWWNEVDEVAKLDDIEFSATQLALRERIYTAESRSTSSSDEVEISRLRASFGRRLKIRIHHLHFQKVLANSTFPGLPTRDELAPPPGNEDFRKVVFDANFMRRCFYPDNRDIRAIFFQCLAVTGWNVAVLLDLDATSDFIEWLHPDRVNLGASSGIAEYLMTGAKHRAGSAVHYRAMAKSQSSAGVLITMNIKRTAPLREQLRQELAKQKVVYESLSSTYCEADELTAAYSRILKLERGIRSAWLYVDLSRGINWLHASSFNNRQSAKDGSYLNAFIATINKQVPDGFDALPPINPEQLRDIYADYIYQVTDGDLVAVQAGLEHKNPTTTEAYLRNRVQVSARRERIRSFSNNLFDQLAMGRVDPTLLAQLCSEKQVTAEQKSRLIDYRKLRVSRIGIFCKDPFSPPKEIDRSRDQTPLQRCTSHRCTLCMENAIATPESFDGICMRLAELAHIKSHISAIAYHNSSYLEEEKNARLILEGLASASSIQARVTEWSMRINSGEHKVASFM